MPEDININYFTIEEVLNYIGKGLTSVNRLIKENTVDYIVIKNKKYYYKKDIYKIKEKLECQLNLNDTCKYLNLTSIRVKKIEDTGELKSYINCNNNRKFYLKEDLDKIIKKIKEWNEKYNTIDELKDILNLNETQIINYLNKNKIEKYDIPAYINTASIKAIKRDDISILLNNINYESKVITKEEAKRILNLGDVIFDRLLKNSKSLFNSTDVLLKSEIEDIKNMQIEFWEKHITQKELINKYKIKPHQIKFKKVNIPDYAKVIDLGKIKLAIRIEDIEKNMKFIQ